MWFDWYGTGKYAGLDKDDGYCVISQQFSMGTVPLNNQVVKSNVSVKCPVSNVLINW